MSTKEEEKSLKRREDDLEDDLENEIESEGEGQTLVDSVLTFRGGDGGRGGRGGEG
jgi:hypothetical protein